MQHARYNSCFLAVASVVLAGLLAGCSSDDGRPTTGPTGPNSGTGTGDGKGTGPGTGTGGSDETTTEENATAPSGDAPKGNAEGPCESGDQCESGVCFVGNNQSYCSVKCTPEDAPTVCVAPFTGSCNKQGYCKRD